MYQQNSVETVDNYTCQKPAFKSSPKHSTQAASSNTHCQLLLLIFWIVVFSLSRQFKFSLKSLLFSSHLIHYHLIQPREYPGAVDNSSHYQKSRNKSATIKLSTRHSRLVTFSFNFRSAKRKDMRLGPDPSSYAQPDLVKVTHIDLDWSVNFQERILAGTAAIKFLIVAKAIEEIVSMNNKIWILCSFTYAIAVSRC